MPPQRRVNDEQHNNDVNNNRTTTAKMQQHSTQPCGGMRCWVVVAFFSVHLLLVAFPAWAYFHYDFVSATLHLEEPRVLADEAVVQSNRAIGLTNLLWVIPLNLAAIVGLSGHCCCCSCGGKGRGNGSNDDRQATTKSEMISPPSLPPQWAFTASYMLLGVAMYWPLQFGSSRWTYSSAGIDHVPLQGGDLATLTLVLVGAAWSTWFLSTYQQQQQQWQLSLMTIRATLATTEADNHREEEAETIGYGALAASFGLVGEHEPLHVTTS